MKSAIVVGAGFAGLAAALELARAGVAVTVFEAADRAGGRAQELISPDGRFRFDMGPTVIVMIDALRGALGDAAFEELRLRRLEPGYRVLWPDGSRFDMHSDVALWLGELARYQGVTGAPRALDYLARVHEAHVESRRRILEVDLGPVAAARLLLRPGKLRPWALGNLRRFTECHFRHPRVIEALTFQTLYLGMSPLRSPAIYALLAAEEIVGGVWYAPGGTAAIVATLVRACERLGVRFLYDTPVTRVDVRSAKEANVVANERVHRADAVIVTADREPALGLFGRPSKRTRPRHGWASKRARPRYGHSAIVYYLGVTGDVNLPHHSVHLPDDPWKSYAELDAGRVPVEPLVYVSNAARSEPHRSTQSSALAVLAPVPNRLALPTFDEEALYARVLQTIER
ncbi:MAG: FAD-dependent oxidoreductase, partial [Candidatus Eremiobacteraeota bacterium]|nr:FAD-dependent oxidoreductase [Candidatus Eremiobacteraeota bacterium]